MVDLERLRDKGFIVVVGAFNGQKVPYVAVIGWNEYFQSWDSSGVYPEWVNPYYYKELSSPYTMEYVKVSKPYANTVRFVVKSSQIDAYSLFSLTSVCGGKYVSSGVN